MSMVWEGVQGSLRAKLGPQNFEIWIRPIRAEVRSDAVLLRVPNRYYRDWVQANYGSTLREELMGALGRSVAVEFEVDRGDEPAAAPAEAPVERPLAPPASAPASEPLPPAPSSIALSADKTFENFVVGACNQFAHAAALAVADEPGEPQYNPLFIFGGTGLGKTHLLYAIGNRALQRDPTTRVIYLTAEQFTNDLIDALRYRRMPEFRDRYRKYPCLLLMDDVQFLSGKDRTQEELFHTFEWLKERGHQIVFTADVLPREIKGLEPRLRSRCESGMLADMQPPDLETLEAILRQKADELSIPMDSELSQYITTRIRGSIREMEGVLNRLKALCRLHNTRPDVEFARRHLGHMLAEASVMPSAQEIIETVATYYNVSVADLLGTRRHKQLVRPRHVAMWLVRKHTDQSFPDMGRTFGRDHATVQHAVKKMAEESSSDPDVKVAIQTILRNLGV